MRINHRYGVYLHVMSRWLMITLPPWIPPAEDKPAGEGPEYTQALNAIEPEEAEIGELGPTRRLAPLLLERNASPCKSHRRPMARSRP